MYIRLLLMLVLVLPGWTPAGAHNDASETTTPASATPAPTTLAPGYGELGYALPAVGSYALPPLGEAADGEVLDSDGEARRLYELFGDRYVLLAFIYTNCSDVNGCPLTSHVFNQIKTAMQRDPEIFATPARPATGASSPPPRKHSSRRSSRPTARISSANTASAGPTAGIIPTCCGFS